MAHNNNNNSSWTQYKFSVDRIIEQGIEADGSPSQTEIYFNFKQIINCHEYFDCFTQGYVMYTEYLQGL